MDWSCTLAVKSCEMTEELFGETVTDKAKEAQV